MAYEIIQKSTGTIVALISFSVLGNSASKTVSETGSIIPESN